MRHSTWTAALTCATVGALAACTTAGDPEPGTDQPTDATPTAESPSPTAEPDPSPTPSPSGPGPVAAVTAEGQAVLLDPTSGAVTEVLLEGVDVSDPASVGIARAPGSETVFVTRPGREAGDDEIVRVAVGDEPQVVASGSAPAVSPDGETLAYTSAQEGRPPEPTIVLHDLGSGSEQTLRSDTTEPFFHISDLTWSADGDELAFTAGEILTGVHVVPTDAGSLDASRRLGPADEEVSWRASAALPEDRLAVVAVTGDLPGPEGWTVETVDLTDGAVLEEPLPVDRIEVGALAAPSGQDASDALVLVDGLTPEGGTLLHWDGGGELVELAEGIVAVGW